MKKEWQGSILALFTMLCIVFITKIYTKDKERKGPGNPGWISQWMEMKKDENGKFPRDRMRYYQQLISSMRLQKSGNSNLINLSELGPDNVGGRTRAFLVDKQNQNRLFAGGISGGLWRSNDGGDNWFPVNDDASSLSITYITQNPFTPQVMYYSTGECAGNSAGIAGDGVYKSTDGGVTFSKLPASNLPAFDYTWRIKCSLSDTHTVYVATRDAGLFRSTDGGNTFVNVIPTTEITDIEVFPDGSIIAAKYAQGLFYSPNGNSGSFISLNNGLPTSGFYRLEMDYCDSLPTTMYVTYENTAGNNILGVYKTTDGGQQWTQVSNPSDEGIAFYFPWYCLALEVKPDNPNYVVIGGVTIGYSTNGGNSWTEHQDSHADYHIFYFNPFNLNQFYVGNDGGVHRYFTSHQIAYMNLNNGYNVTQFYAGAYFPSGTKCWGGTQDNGTQSGSSATMNFKRIFGGDGAFTAIHQQSPNVGYVSWQNGHILKCYNAGDDFPVFDYILGDMDANGDNDIDDDTWFINPFEVNRQDGEQIYFITRDRLWRSIDGGNIWEKATNPITEFYAVGISNEITPTVYLGARNKLRRLDNAITNLPGDEVNLNSLVPNNLNNSFMSNIVVSANDPSVFYCSFSSYVNQPSVYKVTNAKTSSPVWTSIHGDLPAGLPVNWIEVSPYNENIMAAATDVGLFTTVNGGINWTLEDQIPNVSIHQLRLRHSDNQLFIYSHGRGIWTAQLPMTGFSTPTENVTNNVKVYPTITKDEPVRVEFMDNVPFTYELTNMNGQTLMKGKATGSISLSMDKISSGVYNLMLNNKHQTITKKIIKQ